MLLEFVLPILATTLFVFLPGILLLLGLRLNALSAVCFAPVISTLLLSVTGAVLSALGVFCTWANVFFVSLVPGGFLLAFDFIDRKFFADKDDVESDADCEKPKEALRMFNKMQLFWRIGCACCFRCYGVYGLLALLYVAVGVGLGAFLFLDAIPGPNSFCGLIDNIFHTGTIRTFVNTGVWSFFGVNHNGGLDESLITVGSNSFYPTAWHTLAAMIISAQNVSVAMAENTVNFVYSFVVFPISCFALVAYLFKGKVAPIVVGAATCLASISYPWRLLIWGPIFPNLQSLSMVPAVAVMFLMLFESIVTKPKDVKKIALSAGIFFLALVGLVIAQSNAIFTLGVFFIPYLIINIGKLGKTVPKKFLFGLATALAIAILWVGCLQVPLIKTVAECIWPPTMSVEDAIKSAVTFQFENTFPQYIVAALVFVGVIYSFIKREFLWVTLAFLFMMFIYVLCISTEGDFKQAMGGFWYTDTKRLSASASIYAVPLAVLGVMMFAKGGNFVVSKIKQSKALTLAKYAVGTVVLVGLAVSIYIPIMPDKTDKYTATPFYAYRYLAHGEYSGNIVYTTEEQNFVNKVIEKVGDDLVINMPEDGSAFAYGTDDLNTLYRYHNIYDENFESDGSKLIRAKLNEISTNKDVAQAVKDTGAKYLLKLDQGDGNPYKSRYFTTYDPSYWVGVDSVNDNTPGFKVVLSEGDMRLYKILQ